jgi:hypothetical protein
MDIPFEDYIAVARRLWASEEIELDDDLGVSDVSPSDTGAWVRAWVWVDNDDITE